MTTRQQDIAQEIVTEIVGLLELTTIPPELYEKVQEILEKHGVE